MSYDYLEDSILNQPQLFFGETKCTNQGEDTFFSFDYTKSYYGPGISLPSLPMMKTETTEKPPIKLELPTQSLPAVKVELSTEMKADPIVPSPVNLIKPKKRPRSNKPQTKTKTKCQKTKNHQTTEIGEPTPRNRI